MVLAVAVHSLWGGNAVAIKIGLEAFPPMWTAFLRFTFAVVCVVLWAWFRGIPMRPQRSEWWWLVLLGVFFFIQIGSAVNNIHNFFFGHLTPFLNWV